MRLTAKIMIGVSLIIVLVNVAVFYLIGWRYEHELREALTETARGYYKLVVVMRAWVAQHSGVFVRKQPGVKANPFLEKPSLYINGGDTLFLRNPAMVTRELSQLSANMGQRFRFHITSLHPVNPENVPDEFEREALQKITNGEREQLTRYGEFTRVESIDGKRHFRYFAPLYTEESCLSCHGQQGYKVGEVRGGISIILPTDQVELARTQNYTLLILGCILASVAISLLVYYVVRGTVIKPVRTLEQAAERIGKGDYETAIPEQAEDEIGDLGNAMAKMQQAIRESISRQIETEKMFTLGQLSAGIAHEIRNPLFAIRNDLDYLKRTFVANEQHLEIYSEMEDGLQRISHTVNAVLDYARPHSSEFGRYHIHEVIRRCMTLLGKQMQQEKTRIAVNIDDELPAIDMDIHRMEQVFVNLLTNALHATRDRNGEILVSAKRCREGVEIVVSDNGCGIKKSDLQRIFDPFFTRSPNGTGLGLTIVRKIIAEHHGAIKVKSEEGMGAAFIIHLPITQKEWHQP